MKDPLLPATDQDASFQLGMSTGPSFDSSDTRSHVDSDLQADEKPAMQRSYMWTITILRIIGCYRDGRLSHNPYYAVYHYAVVLLLLLAIALLSFIVAARFHLAVFTEIFWYIHVLLLYVSFYRSAPRLMHAITPVMSLMPMGRNPFNFRREKPLADKLFVAATVLAVGLSIANCIITVFGLLAVTDNVWVVAILTIAKIPQSFVWLLQVVIVMHWAAFMHTAISYVVNPSDVPKVMTTSFDDKLRLMSKYCREVNCALRWQLLSLCLSHFVIVILLSVYMARRGQLFNQITWLFATYGLLACCFLFGNWLHALNDRISFLLTHEAQCPDDVHQMTLVQSCLVRLSRHPFCFTLGPSQVALEMALFVRISSLIVSAVIVVYNVFS